VVLLQKIPFVPYTETACGGVTKQREIFRLPSSLFAGPPGREQSGRHAEGGDHKKPSKQTGVPLGSDLIQFLPFREGTHI